MTQAVLAQTPTHLLYLHGFRSSPLSFKAQRLQGWLAEHRPEVHWWCPQLPASPREAMALLLHGIAHWPAHRSAVLGSSLGGFYATVVAEHTGWPAVLINPAVNPSRDLAAHVGLQTAYHSPAQSFVFEAGYVQELQAMTPLHVTRPERYLPIIATGDEVLSWQEMSQRYKGSALRLVQGSDHALSDFDEHLPALLRFLRL